MSEPSPGPGWWLASDGKWYAPEFHPSRYAQSDEPGLPTLTGFDPAPQERGQTARATASTSGALNAGTAATRRWSRPVVVVPLIALVLAAVVVVAVTARSSHAPEASAASTTSTPSASAAIIVNPCQLLTLADVQMAIGTATEQEGASAKLCAYRSGQSILTVELFPGLDERYYAAQTQGFTPIPGIGDAAAYHVDGTGTGYVELLHGSDLVNLKVRLTNAAGVTTPASAATLEALARAVNSSL